MAKVRIRLPECAEEVIPSLFSIYNTAHNALYVLAKDRETALYIGYCANHIVYKWKREDAAYPNCEEMREPYWGEVQRYTPSIKAAIEQRLQGTVHFENGEVSIGSKRITI